MASPKIFQKGAFKLERSSDGTLHAGWGKQPAETITATDGIPYITFTNKPTINHVEDNQVTGNAFKTGKRLVGKFYEGDFETLDKFSGLNDFIYFNFQWEEAVVTVAMYKGTLDSGDLVVGETFQDVDTNSFTFLGIAPTRDINGVESDIYIFSATVATTLQTGTLTNQDSAGNDLTFTSHSGLKYRHRFTFDSRGRNLRDFTTAEKTALGNFVSGDDQKSPFATLAKEMNDTYDFVYANTMATSFEITCSAADLFHIKPKLMAPYQVREAGIIPEALSIDCEAVSLENAPAHYQTIVKLAPEGGALVEYGITDISIKAESPMDKLQTTTSGVGLAEPYMEGKYSLMADMTVGRHEVELFQNYRDSNSPMWGEMTMTRGWDVQQMHFKKIYINDAGPDEGDIAAEPINMELSWECDNTYFNDTQNSPVLFDVYDDSPYNAMTGRNSAGAFPA